MKNKILAMVLSVIMIFGMIPMSSFTAFAVESEPVVPVEITAEYAWYSAEAEVYEIDSIAKLVGLANITNGKDGQTKFDFAGKTVKLTQSLTFANNQYWFYANSDNTIVYDYQIGSFAGTFDGQGNTITGLKFYNANTGQNPNMYLFYTITATGSIKNITLDTVTADINSDDHFGFLAKNLYGNATECHIKNVNVNVEIDSKGRSYLRSTGIMFGYASSATIETCSVNKASISGAGNDTTDLVGALVGQAEGTEEKHTTISKCSVNEVEYNFANKTKRFGGFVGYTKNTDIADCTACDVTINIDNYCQHVGGFVGTVADNSSFTRCTVDKIVMDLDASENSGYVGGFSSSVSGNNISFIDCSVTNLDIDAELRYKNYGYIGGFTCNVGGSGTVVFEGCSASGNIDAEDFDSNSPVGGFFGYTSNGNLRVTDCVADVNVTVPYAAGGFVGKSSGGNFIDCEAKGSVSGNTAGGFIGEIVPNTGNVPDKNISIDNCTANGAVTGETVAAGFVGSMTTAGENNANATTVVISNSTGSSNLTSENGETVTFAKETVAEGSTSHFHNMTVSVRADKEEYTVGDTVFISVNIADDANESFNAAELEITFPKDNLTFNIDGSTLNGASATAENGVLSLADYGAAQSYGNGVYVLAFTATKAGTASISLASAGFGTAVSAENANLTRIDCTNVETSITIQHNVNLPDIFSGNVAVTDGEDYIFSIESATGQYYNYTAPTATIGGVEALVVANQDGTWTVANVTGELVITGSRTPKTFNVTVSGDNASNDGATATYGTNYTFTLADDLAASTLPGYFYTVTSVTIGGVAYTGYSSSNRVYTIPGTAVTGAIVITISKTVTEPNQFNITTSGNANGDVALSDTVVDKNGNVTLTLTPERGYGYTVKVGGNEITPNENVYTVSGITAAVEFEVTKWVDISTAETDAYLSLTNGSTMNYVVIGEETQLENKTYTYKGQEMFWSEHYKAYVTLVIPSTQIVAEGDDPTFSSSDFAIVDGTATVIKADEQDINKSGTVDANDAQLIWNIYNGQYTEFTDDVTVEKFLRADANGDYEINVSDAVEIINTIVPTETPAEQ